MKIYVLSKDVMVCNPKSNINCQGFEKPIVSSNINNLMFALSDKKLIKQDATQLKFEMFGLIDVWAEFRGEDGIIFWYITEHEVND